MTQQVECDIKPLSANAFAFFSYFGAYFWCSNIHVSCCTFVAERQTKLGQNVDQNFDVILPYGFEMFEMQHHISI